MAVRREWIASRRRLDAAFPGLFPPDVGAVWTGECDRERRVTNRADPQAERAADLIKQDNSGPTPPTSSSSAAPSSSSSSSARPSSSSAAPPTTTGRAIHPNGDTTKCLQARGQADGALVE